MRYLTAGESHGRCISAVIEGMPSNVKIDLEKINLELKRRQSGYGRGNRMNIENDEVIILSGIRNSLTTGSPIMLQIKNKDWENWAEIMDIVKSNGEKAVFRPRPGHADLGGIIKYDLTDIRDVLERASARETAVRTAVGSIAMQLLENLGIVVKSHVLSIGNVHIKGSNDTYRLKFDNEFWSFVESSDMFCSEKDAEVLMKNEIDNAKRNGDTLGGVFEAVAYGMPVGVGSYVQWDRKLDAKIAYNLMSIQSVKGVEFGYGFSGTELYGSKYHDEIFYSDEGYNRKTNGAGGIEGGMSNGNPIIVRCAVKPIPTLGKPLKSVDIKTKKPLEASYERSDICAVPAASVVGKAVFAWALADAVVSDFAGDINYLKQEMAYINKRK